MSENSNIVNFKTKKIGDEYIYNDTAFIIGNRGPNWIALQPTKDMLEEQRSYQRSKHSTEKTCILCNVKFDYGYTSLSNCTAM